MLVEAASAIKPNTYKCNTHILRLCLQLCKEANCEHTVSLRVEVHFSFACV